MVIETEIYYCKNVKLKSDEDTHTFLVIALRLIRGYYLYIKYQDNGYYAREESPKIKFYLLEDYRNKYIPKKELIDFINQYSWCNSYFSKSKPMLWINQNITCTFKKRQEITIDSSLLYFKTNMDGLITMSSRSGIKRIETAKKIIEDSEIRFIKKKI